MRHFFSFCAMIASVFACNAQTVIDNFTVGPYVVDYKGEGDVNYRLRDNIDLYEFYELQRDTTVVAAVTEVPLKHAIEIAGRVGANRLAAKEIGLEAVWKQNIGKNLYFNGGLSFTIDHADFGDEGARRNMFEVGVPLQIELGKLNRQRASLFGSFGIAPTVYTTINASKYDEATRTRVDDVKKSGFLIAPSLEFGGNIPVGSVIMRIGVYGTYKINCTKSDYDVYGQVAGRMFLGAKIGIVL